MTAIVMLVMMAATEAVGPRSAPSANIALGVPYTMDPAPNYEYCTDPEDVKQLTDGVYSEGYFWTQKSTVGWTNAKPVIITLDLGAVKPIRGVSYNTAAGVAGVVWPTAILVLVADADPKGTDDKQFHEAGELVALSAKHGEPAPEGYSVHRYWTDALKTHGRYVALAVWGQPFTFVDEIEVYAGERDWVQAPLVGEPIADIKAYALSLAVREAVSRRLRQDVAGVRENAGRPEIPEAARREVLAEVDAVAEGLKDLPSHYGDDFRAVLPLNPAHARVFRAQAKLWQADGCARLTAWQSGLWDPLRHLADPPREANAAVDVCMMSHEYRAGAFNLSNATPDDMTVDLRIAGVPGGPNPPYLTVHEVAWTDTHSGVPVAAALPEAERKGDAWLIHVPSGLTRQVWLTFHPTDVPAGTYVGKIQLNSGADTAEVPLTLRLYPLRFPDRPRLHFGGWDYTDVPSMYGVTVKNREPLVAHLREHFVDSPWGTSGVMPHGKHDANGNMTAPPDTANFDAWLQLWPGARQYCVFAAVPDRFDTFAMGTPEFEKAVKAWITFWAAHAKEKGVKPEQMSLLLVDETSGLDMDAIILAWAKVIRAADTGIRIWEDPTYHDMTKANQDMVAACHVLCPNRQIFLSSNDENRAYYAQQQKKGIELQFYSCSGPVRLLDPYAYHRLQAWTCWQTGATATYFWAFGDTGGASAWNEYAAKGSAYTPLFLGADSVTAGKHMEACREGVEDFEYLAMLHDAVDAAAAKGTSSDTVTRARNALAELPNRVCASGVTKSFHWNDEHVNRTDADKARREILDLLVALQEGK